MANTTELPFIVSGSWAILLFPILSFIVNGLWLCRKSHKAAAAFSITMASASFLWAMGLLSWYMGNVFPNPDVYEFRTVLAWSMDWMMIQGDLVARMGFYLDPISMMMVVVVTTIALLVNIYSNGYMEGDPAKGRFFALLSLFTFSMLGLVISSNIFQMFVFWELVGVSSYSLIGFWYHKPAAVAASKKAFIVTRFADAFFLLGIVAVSWVTKSFDFTYLNSPEAAEKLKTVLELGFFSSIALNVGTLLIFTGGWGKSAMFPMHVWLPDAMEGPTPVSSIIHSATMVVAGVYLTARMFPLFAAAEYTLQTIMWVGVITAAFAAIIAITQKDIKRILAFSTLSQLGYMLFSLGAASIADGQPGEYNPMGYSASMFHVFTHAFFKCMLFLGAGSIIHACHSNFVDNMGGLKKKMPWTYWSLGLATLAISGIPPFSGFFSKDEIILGALQSGNTVVAILGLIVGGLTAFYMFRFFFLIFHGEARGDISHAHEDKWMTAPIVVLTIPTVFAGLLMHTFVDGVLPGMAPSTLTFEKVTWLPYVASAMGIGGTLLAYYFYGRKGANVAKAINVEGRPAWYTVVYNKFYFDEAYYWITREIILKRVAGVMHWIDSKIIDGSMNLIGFTTKMGGFFVRQIQNGHIPLYVTAMIFGILFIYFLGKLPIL